MEVTKNDPAEILDETDPGDETQRNFRYQHAYGVILLIAGAASVEPYSAVWCEHHEDVLAERVDGSYDAYQIKTRQPERGYCRFRTIVSPSFRFSFSPLFRTILSPALGWVNT